MNKVLLKLLNEECQREVIEEQTRKLLASLVELSELANERFENIQSCNEEAWEEIYKTISKAMLDCANEIERVRK